MMTWGGVAKSAVGAIVIVALAVTVAGCGGGSASSSKASSGASTKKKDTSGCLVGASSCAGGSTACTTLQNTIETELANTAKSTVEITVGVSPITSKAKIAKDRQKISKVITQLTAIRAAYLACPGHDPNFDANVKALKTYLH